MPHTDRSTVFGLELLTLFLAFLAAQLPGGLHGETTEPRADILVDDFERAEYAPWTAEGEAFGPGPAQGTLPNQMRVSGYSGKRLVNSYYHGDGTTGTLTSPSILLERNYLCFLIGGGGFPDETYIELLVDGQSVRRATGPNTVPGGSEELDWAAWDIREFQGKTATIRIVDRRTGFWGHINIDRIVQSDRDYSKLPNLLEMPVQHRLCLLPVTAGEATVHCRLKHGDHIVRYFDIALPQEEEPILYWAPVDVADFVGQTLTWEVRPRIATERLAQVIKQADEPIWPEDLYHEARRPQFHFSPRVGWTNDPNGLVYYDGEYHLFFQHNPYGIRWGNMTWGHAVSRDLIHWQELGDAILPDEKGTIFSGSAVLDSKNTSGLGRPDAPALCAFYTAAGGHSYQPCPFTQCMAYSLDRGRSWTKFSGNPVVDFTAEGNRDPKVFWHEPTQRWIMVLYVRRDAFSLFSSSDLKNWQAEGEIPFPTAHECPELFPLPIDNNPQDIRWVLWSASGNHLIGQFDGRSFTAESDVLRSEWGKNSYAGQTWNNVPDGRRIFIAWMNSDGSAYQGMPFNQQMTIPRELSLRKTADGLRLFAQPVKELSQLRRRSREVRDVLLDAQQPERVWRAAELADVQLNIQPTTASQVIVQVRGVPIVYQVADRVLECLCSRTEPLPEGENLTLRILVDRTSLEIFAVDGRYVMSFCHPFDPAQTTVSVRAEGGAAKLNSAAIHELHSIWP